MRAPEEHPQRIHVRSDLQPGDIGYVTYLHGILYAREYQWDVTFEGYVAQSLAEFALAYDPRKDRLWVAEIGGRIVGSVGIVGRSDSEAQLRWFLVDPTCRGQSLGQRLLDEAIRFCRERDFKSIFLWTVSG
ncbi:MAG: GNAT family N-acetyltransferase [Planctomycetota bacterium]